MQLTKVKNTDRERKIDEDERDSPGHSFILIKIAIVLKMT